MLVDQGESIGNDSSVGHTVIENELSNGMYSVLIPHVYK
jgi:hypothetical protein